MVVLKRERRILGRKNNTGVPVKNAKVIPANPYVIDKINRKFREDCARFRANAADADLAAKEMIAGPSYEKGKTLTKKL